MITFSLQSGSNGNSIYVEAGEVGLLFDAGISGRQAQTRMASRQRDIRDCHGVIISHGHSDHLRCAGVFQRKFGLPVYIAEQTYRAACGLIGPVSDVRTFVPGDRLQFDGLTVRTIRTPHDAIDSVCFVVEHDDKKLGIFTDLGHPFGALGDALEELDAVYLESNYDADMLRNGPYPEVLKNRIAGAGGHLSNDEAADLAKRHLSRRLKWLAVAHLSEQNNEPDIAIATHRRKIGAMLPLHHASRYGVGELLEV
ncbi:MAG: MBL fold metallo-hydrolase [Phycisphaerae bacterium]|nr:MBL fold metallo-hydrolase [Phycisphaerae bacterium]